MYKLRLFFVENNSRNFIISFRARAMVIEEMNGFITVKCFAFCILFSMLKFVATAYFPLLFDDISWRNIKHVPINNPHWFGMGSKQQKSNYKLKMEFFGDFFLR